MIDGKEFERLASVVPMDLAALQAWRAERPGPAPGSHWELTVDAGGPLGVLEPPALELARVAALGAALSGVGYVAFGLYLRLPAPAGSDPDDPKPPGPQSHEASFEPLRRAQAELHRRLRDLGADLPGAMALRTGRVRREDGALVLPGRSETKVLVGRPEDGFAGVLDPSRWSTFAGEPLGEPWAAYGVVLRVEHEFPMKRFPTNPPAGFTGPFGVGPAVDDDYWTRLGEVFTTAAASVVLPSWPLHQASLHDPGTRSRQEKCWQQLLP
jgi:hypothetical protein